MPDDELKKIVIFRPKLRSEKHLHVLKAHWQKSARGFRESYPQVLLALAF